jgi:acyl carrier protein
MRKFGLYRFGEPSGYLKTQADIHPPQTRKQKMSYTFTLAEHALEAELKKLILQEADKTDDVAAEDFTDDAPLFGDGSPVDLDSLDALQICVALQQYFQVRLQGDRMVRKHMMCVRDLAALVRAEHGA